MENSNTSSLPGLQNQQFKKIVFATDLYPPEATANTNCAKNVIDCLKAQGHNIEVVCTTQGKTVTQNIDGITVHRIHFISYSDKLAFCTSPLKRKIMRLFHFAKSVLVLPLFPNVNPSVSVKIYNKLCDISKKNNVGCVIGIFRPFCTIGALTRFKNKNNNITCIGYYLDILKATDKPVGVPASFYDKLCDKREFKVFSKLDKILMAECGKYYYDKEYFSCVKDKITYLNFPTLLEKNYAGIKESQSCNIVYAGSTNDTFRNPIKAIKVFTELKKDIPNLQFHLYGKTSIAHKLKKLEAQSNGAFFYHGLVEKSQADEIIKNADFLLNFGNDSAGLVPSKVFELISTAKPIIHFTPGDNDYSTQYIKKYKNALVIDYRASSEAIIRVLSDFIKSPKETIAFEKIKNEFYSATPDAVAQKIIDAVDMNK